MIAFNWVCTERETRSSEKNAEVKGLRVSVEKTKIAAVRKFDRLRKKGRFCVLFVGEMEAGSPSSASFGSAECIRDVVVLEVN